MSSVDYPFDEVLEEIHSQNKTWGMRIGMSPFIWVAILAEEVGEFAEAVLNEDAEGIDEELIQCAAVAINALAQLRETRRQGESDVATV